jgi:phosphate/sulfate permease
MEQYYIFLVAILFLLAISDLVVGVSNDAVNFLNSAIGSKVASRRTIMIVASSGILMGAIFSSGMMEVARKGIFNPELYFFSDVMTIFLAVMITDIILLDLFNTFGLPTSTTVSIVFELLGAAVAVSLIKILSNNIALGELGNYINSSSALTIISGIFLSVGIAFLLGAVVQFFSRLLFTFDLKSSKGLPGIIWSGLALTALTYFLLIKGIKGASFITTDFIDMVQDQSFSIMVIGFVLLSVLMYLLNRIFQLDVLRIVVLFGTFSLAMAFAGNDLVNFIGVPIAGLEAFTYYRSAGVAPDTLLMSFLNSPIRTDTYLLVIAGLIMIVTLWFSKKARSVTDTEVNLGRQDEGDERFRANLLAKGIVRSALLVSERLNKVFPPSLLKKANDRFNEPDPNPPDNSQQPAFDMVRASVNLTVASILIAIATSFKLPLSTTYVSFMVAMGTSLADKAWGRSSAVFRVSGVIHVIGGWFFTAFMAFTAAAVFATLIYYFNIPAVVLLMLLAVVMVSRTFMLHRKKERAQAAIQNQLIEEGEVRFNKVIEKTTRFSSAHLRLVEQIYTESLQGLVGQDRGVLKKAGNRIQELTTSNEVLKRKIFKLSKKLKPGDTDSAKLYLLVYDLQQDMLQSISLIAKTCTEYVENSLEPVNGACSRQLKELNSVLGGFIERSAQTLDGSSGLSAGELLVQKRDLLERIENYLEQVMHRIQKKEHGMRNSLLLFTIYLESKDLVAVTARFTKLYDRVINTGDQSRSRMITGPKT